MFTNFATILALSAIASTASAFWGTGHLLISRRAQAILAEKAPDALSAALDDLYYLQKSYPSLVEEDGEHSFTECATFGDNIKGKGYSWQSDWHFIDQPAVADGGSIEDYPDFKMSETDVLDALQSLTDFLKGEDMTGNTYVDKIKESFDDEKDQVSFALRLIIHYVGDIHQPLHAVSGVSDEYPKGDRGGNSEWIDPSIDGVKNLHSVWDSVIYSYTGYPDTPLSDKDWDWYTSEVADLAQNYPIDSSNLADGEFKTWGDESLHLAKTIVYPDFVEHVVPTDEYKARALPVMKERLMYGGARLAALIESIYGDSRLNNTMAFTNKVLAFLN